jgi:hypothetical protein
MGVSIYLRPTILSKARFRDTFSTSNLEEGALKLGSYIIQLTRRRRDKVLQGHAVGDLKLEYRKKRVKVDGSRSITRRGKGWHGLWPSIGFSSSFIFLSYIAYLTISTAPAAFDFLIVFYARRSHSTLIPEFLLTIPISWRPCSSKYDNSFFSSNDGHSVAFDQYVRKLSGAVVVGLHR